MLKTENRCFAVGVCLAILLLIVSILGILTEGEVLPYGVGVAALVVFLTVFVPSATLLIREWLGFWLSDRLSAFVWGYVVWGTFVPPLTLGLGTFLRNIFLMGLGK